MFFINHVFNSRRPQVNKNTKYQLPQKSTNFKSTFAICLQRHTLWYVRAVFTVRIFEDGLHIWEAGFKLELFVYHNTSGDK